MLFVMLNNPSVQPERDRPKRKTFQQHVLHDWSGATSWLTMQKNNAVGYPRDIFNPN